LKPTGGPKFFKRGRFLKDGPPGSGLLSHYKAPYGKLSSDGYLVLRAMDRDKERLYGPVFSDRTEMQEISRLKNSFLVPIILCF